MRLRSDGHSANATNPRRSTAAGAPSESASLTPNKVTGLQRALTFVEERSLFLAARDGFHPKLGSLTTGSGFAIGQPLNARQGGFYRIERSHYDDRTSGAFTFNRTDIELRQYLGFLAGRRVIALRGVFPTTDAADGADVPFYLMPFLGGKDSLRGFRDYRFRAPHSLLLQGEYRWEIWSGLEGSNLDGWVVLGGAHRRAIR